MRATGVGQQVAQLHGSCTTTTTTMMMMMMKIRYFLENKFGVAFWNSQE
jgi:hypothetical protein